MDLSLLTTLKETLVEATTFADIFTYFLDHFGEDPEFIELGERVRDPMLEGIIAQVGLQLFGRKVHIDHVLFTYLAEHSFLHGTAMIEGRLSTVIYFRDIHMGLLVVLWTGTPPETKFIRFRGMPMPDRWQRSVN
jgi:hypothetical protein